MNKTPTSDAEFLTIFAKYAILVSTVGAITGITVNFVWKVSPIMAFLLVITITSVSSGGYYAYEQGLVN